MNRDYPAMVWLWQQIESDKWTASVKAIQSAWHIDVEPWATNRVGVVNERDQSVCVTIGEYAAEHIARHDPQDVIADCDAKLAVLAACAVAIEAGEIQPGSTWNDDAAGAAVAADVIRLLAIAYKYRPGYAEHWEATTV